MRAGLPPALRGARGKGGDSLSLGPAPPQPFPGAPAPAPREARVWPPPPARSGAPAPSALCPGPRLDGTQAPRPSLTPRPPEARSYAPQAQPSWAPCSPKVKGCDNPLPLQPSLGQEKASFRPRKQFRAVEGGEEATEEERLKGLGKKVVHWAPWALPVQAPKVTGSGTAYFQPGVQELRHRALSGHFCQSLPTGPVQAPPLCLES